MPKLSKYRRWQNAAEHLQKECYAKFGLSPSGQFSPCPKGVAYVYACKDLPYKNQPTMLVTLAVMYVPCKCHQNITFSQLRAIERGE